MNISRNTFIVTVIGAALLLVAMMLGWPALVVIGLLVIVLLVLTAMLAPKGTRTFAINLVGSLPIVADLIAQLLAVPWGDFLSDDAAKMIALILVLANIAIRTVTTTAPFQSD